MNYGEGLTKYIHKDKLKMIQRILLVLKGMAMGAADVVPGVSGGTIAFITGIYEELLASIRSINLASLKLLFKEGFKVFWQKINGTFLVTLFLGIGISVVSLAKILENLLNNYPELIWSFFFGLIIASAIYVSKQVSKWNVGVAISLIAGVVFAYFITVITPAETTNAWWFLVLSGAVAICAMILPGISGSFILLLLGKYAFVLSAVSNFNVQVIALVGLGAVIGLLSFANILSWLLKNFYNKTIAVLSGFMIGSLNKVWPWKQTVETFVDRHGDIKPLLQKNVWAGDYLELTGNEPFLLYALILAVVGFSIIFVVEGLASKLVKVNTK